MTDSHRLPLSPMVDRLIDLALAEDIGHGDITTEPLGLRDAAGRAQICAKEPLVIAGLDLVRRVFEKIDDRIRFFPAFDDGERVEAGSTVARLEGSFHALLVGERTALNFLQRLSGVATHVRTYMESLSHGGLRLVDTRKTVPGWRVLEKYAVRVGGAANHRMGLYDGVLIKDNHIAACGGIASAIAKIRGSVSHLIRIEVETESLDQVEAALEAGADVIMLDNMAPEAIGAAVEMIAGRAVVEVSGRVDREIIALLAALGVDIVSVGALTHAARFVDLSMRIAAAD